MINKRGFTLVELLVVIAIMGILGIIMVAIFTNTLRGSSKSQVLAVIKQNGQAVLETMDKNIRGADNVVCSVDLPSLPTLVIVKNGLYTRYRYMPPGNTSNGYIAQDFPTQPLNQDIKIFANTVCTGPMLFNSQVLTDTNTQTGVSVTSASFTQDLQSGSKSSVTVAFVLKPGLAAQTTMAGQIDEVEFQTTIELR